MVVFLYYFFDLCLHHETQAETRQAKNARKSKESGFFY